MHVSGYLKITPPPPPPQKKNPNSCMVGGKFMHGVLQSTYMSALKHYARLSIIQKFEQTEVRSNCRFPGGWRNKVFLCAHLSK